MGSLGTTERKLILKNNANTLYSPSGFLLFQQHGNLMAQPFDLQHLELQGTASSVADGVAVYHVWQHALFSVSDAGNLAFQTRTDRLVRPEWADRSGKTLESLTDPAPISDGVISRDGNQIAFVIDDPLEGATNIWTLDVAPHVKARLTFEPLIAYFPAWSSDHSRLYFGSNRLGLTQFFSVPVTGLGQAERLFSSEEADIPWWKGCRSRICVTNGDSSPPCSTAGRRSSSRTELRLSSSEDGRTISPNRNESRIWRRRSRRRMRFWPN